MVLLHLLPHTITEGSCLEHRATAFQQSEAIRCDALGGRKALAIRAEGERDGRPRRRVELAVVRRAALEGRGLRPSLEGRLQRLRGRRNGVARSCGPQGRLVAPASELAVPKDGDNAIHPAAKATRLIE